MKPTILAGSANTPLAEAVAARLDIRPSSRKVQVFPDGGCTSSFTRACEERMSISSSLRALRQKSIGRCLRP